MADHCLTCGAILLSGDYCQPGIVVRACQEKKDLWFTGCETIALATTYSARPERSKFKTNLHGMGGASERSTNLERFYSAYGEDCNYSVHGPLPLTEEIKIKT